MRKRAIFVIVSFFALAIAFLIPSITYSKYISNSTEFKMLFSSSSTPPEPTFYFDASLDPDNENNFYRDTFREILMLDDLKEISVLVRNNEGVKVSNQDIEYSISIKENNKFKLVSDQGEEVESVDGTLEYDVGGGAVEDKVYLTLSKVEGESFNTRETLTILVASTSPEHKEIKIQIQIYTEETDESSINYEIHFVELVQDANGDIEINNVKYRKVIKSIIASDEESINGVTLDSVFGSVAKNERLRFTEGNTYYFTVHIENCYTAEIFIGQNGEIKQIPNSEVNEGYPLGTNLVYTPDGDSIVVDTRNGPSTLKLDYFKVLEDVFGDQTIIVELMEKYDLSVDEDSDDSQIPENAPTLDLHYWLKTAGTGYPNQGRGSFGKYKSEDDEKSSSVNDIDTEDGWDWFKNKKYVDGPVTMERAEDGTYGWVMVFQTNSNGNWILNAFEINGYAIAIPFKPKNISNNARTDHVQGNIDEYLKTTVLPDGTIVSIEFIKVFNDKPQRSYRITISNARSNLTVTNGNLNMYKTGAPELVIYSLEGVEGNEIYLGDTSRRLSDLFIFQYSDETGEIRFRIKDYYQLKEVKLMDIVGNGVSITPKSEGNGWYTIPSINKGDIDGIGLLYIIAEPMKFAIQFDKGNVASAEWDANWYDDNGGAYYTIEDTKYMRTDINAPEAAGKIFKYWEVGVGSDRLTIGKGRIVGFEDLLFAAYSNADSIKQVEVNGEYIYVITITAIWWWFGNC